jgi:ABC-2 type transport system ATP-binding protein
LTCAIQLTDVTKEYNGHRVVNDLSLAVPAGALFGLLGPNGAGKTTVMKMMAGLTRPTAGTIRLFGRDVADRSPVTKQWIGLVPQDNNMERELTVEEVLYVYGRLFNLPGLRQKIEQTIDAFSLGDIRHKKVGVLSGGTARRTLIARALLPEPRILLLDEPTVGLDPDVRQDIWRRVEQLVDTGITVVLTTHYMEEADKLCTQVAMLRNGCLAILDTPDGIRKRLGLQNGAEALEAAFIRLAREGGA